MRLFERIRTCRVEYLKLQPGLMDFLTILRAIFAPILPVSPGIWPFSDLLWANMFYVKFAKFERNGQVFLCTNSKIQKFHSSNRFELHICNKVLSQ